MILMVEMPCRILGLSIIAHIYIWVPTLSLSKKEIENGRKSNECNASPSVSGYISVYFLPFAGLKVAKGNGI